MSPLFDAHLFGVGCVGAVARWCVSLVSGWSLAGASASASLHPAVPATAEADQQNHSRARLRDQNQLLLLHHPPSFSKQSPPSTQCLPSTPSPPATLSSPLSSAERRAGLPVSLVSWSCSASSSLSVLLSLVSGSPAFSRPARRRPLSRPLRLATKRFLNGCVGASRGGG